MDRRRECAISIAQEERHGIGRVVDRDDIEVRIAIDQG